MGWLPYDIRGNDILQGTNISPQNGILKMIFLFPRWDMLIPWRVMVGTKDAPMYFPFIKKRERA